jgi:hypothetical protein
VRIIFKDNLPHVIDHTLDDDDDDDLHPKAKNLCLDPLGGETSTPIIQSRHDSDESRIDSDDGKTKEYHHMPVEHPSDLVVQTFLIDPRQEDGQRFFRARSSSLLQQLSFLVLRVIEHVTKSSTLVKRLQIETHSKKT